MKDINWKEIAIVSGCGAVGGLLAWLIAAVSSGLALNWQLGLCTAILGGAVAAGAGVYLLANTDTSNAPRCIFFSVFCGVCWQPIVEAGKNLVNEATVHKEVASAKKEVDDKLGQTAAGTSPKDISVITDSTGKLAEKLPEVTNPELRQDALKTVDKAFAQIKIFGKQNPDQAATALVAIGRKAAASGSSTVRVSAREALEAVRDGSSTPEIWTRVNKSVESLK